MQVRGAPAIGVAGAYGVVLAARALCESAVPAFREELADAAAQLAAARPTAVNLPWAVARTLRAADAATDAADAGERTLREAQAIEAEDLQANMAIGAYGAALAAAGRASADALQHGRSCHRRIRHRARRGARRVGAGGARRGCRNRDPSPAAGRALDSVGADAGRHPHDAHRR